MFHTFPANPEICDKWIRANPRDDFVPTKYSRLRSLHFQPSDIVQFARISKLFLAAEKGRLAEFVGKTLDQISLDDAGDLENPGSESSASDVEEMVSGNELQQDDEDACPL